MKKILVSFILVFLLFSCGNDTEELKGDKIEDLVKEEVQKIEIPKEVEKNKNELEEEMVLNAIDELLGSGTITDTEVNNTIIKDSNIENEISTGDSTDNNKDIEDIDQFDCEGAYEEITKERRTENIKEFGVDYSNCYFDISDTGCSKNTEDGRQVNIQVILDYSKSMLSTIGGVTRMSIAKESVNGFIEVTDKKNNIGLLAYGHKGGSDCVDIEQLVELGQDNRDAILEKIKIHEAKGYTPIAKSLTEAGKILSEYDPDDYENHILLITDGIESCKGDPVAEALKLAKQGIIVSVIGFGVNDEVSKTLEQITNISHGKYYRSKTIDELKKGLADFEQNHSCYMDKAMNSLNQSLDLMSDAFACTHALNMEKSMELMEIGNLFDVPEECKKKLVTKTKLRYINIKRKIDSNIKEAEDKVKDLNEGVKEANENMIDDYQDSNDIYDNIDKDFGDDEDLDDDWDDDWDDDF